MRTRLAERHGTVVERLQQPDWEKADVVLVCSVPLST
jgi:hypothetical protein